MKKIDRRVVDASQLRMVRSLLRARNEYYITGLHSIFIPSRQEKWLDKKVVRDWPDLDGEVVPMTPGEAARTELQREFPTLKKVGWFRDHIHLLDARWPMYFATKYHGDGAYFDIKSAYYQLYNRLWLDVCYPRGMGKLDLSPIAAKLQHWKAARNGLIGVTISRQTTGVKGPKRIKVTTTNQFLSPHLWATIQGLLNELAMTAIELGAIYVATDGYIFPKKSQYLVFGDFLKDVGLQYHYLYNEITIRGWSSYAVGLDKVTVPFAKGYPGGQEKVFRAEWPMGERLGLISWWSKAVPTYRERMGLLCHH